jgi:hypothetical protein
MNSTNNQLNIIISGVLTTYTFPTGNYNITSFITQWGITVGSGWTLTFNSVYNSINFVYTSNFTFNDVGVNSMFGIIGFVNNISYSSFNNSLSSFCSVNFGGITKLNIKSSTFYLNNVESFTGTVGRIICSVPVSSPQNGYIFYENYTNYKSIFTNRCINTINIEIMDDFGNYINFNNIDFTITLQIDILREVLFNYDSVDDIYEKEKNNVDDKNIIKEKNI